VVVGAGYIGLELGIVYRKLGVDVSVVEAAERVLPAYDAELVRPVADSLARLGVRLWLGHKVLGLDKHGAVRVQAADGAEQTLPA
ncbi:FAD-dependent oxidoreductase, partial [Burkholderia cenocepacia]|nr:FAD-dependent oxidoreductase [Burkholderia cenocepacia]